MRLYTATRPPNPRRVNMFITEKGLWNRIVPVEMDLATDCKTPEHLARNPRGEVPVLDLGDGRALSESRAICAYLEAIAPEPNLMGETPEERAFIEMFDRRMEFQVLWPLMNWVRHGHPGLAALEPIQVSEWASLAETKARAGVEWLNDDLAHREWVAGGRFTIADITAFCGIEFARLMKFRPWEDLPHVARWREAMLARPSASPDLPAA